MKPAHSIEDLKTMVERMKVLKRSPAYWEAKLQDAINADLEATVDAKKRKAA